MLGSFTRRTLRGAAVTIGLLTAAVVIPGGSASAASTQPPTPHPVTMPTLQQVLQRGQTSPIQPPPVYTGPIGCVVITCVWPVAPVGQPTPVNMAYFGGHVQVAPQLYLILWGWGETGSFNHTNPGMPTNDPDGAGQRMIDFLSAMGGTQWAGVAGQYYETVNGTNVDITNPTNILAGVWWDNTDSIRNNLSDLNIAQEADRGLSHFEHTDPSDPTNTNYFNPIDLSNANFIVATPQMRNDKGFNQGGYCAWHDYSTAYNGTTAIYPNVTPDMSFTNMPYVANEGGNCAADSVNPAPDGDIDAFTIALGHEVEETITDPGAEEKDAAGVQQGAWYDFTGYENGDKCAYVGLNPVGVGPEPLPIPGALANVTMSDGKAYPVQSMWSNDSGAGAGWCAGNGNDLPA